MKAWAETAIGIGSIISITIAISIDIRDGITSIITSRAYLLQYLNKRPQSTTTKAHKPVFKWFEIKLVEGSETAPKMVKLARYHNY